MRDQIAYCAFYSFLVEVQMNKLLATSMQHMCNNDLEIRIDVLSSFKSVRNDLVESMSDCVFIYFYVGGNFIRVIL